MLRLLSEGNLELIFSFLLLHDSFIDEEAQDSESDLQQSIGQLHEEIGAIVTQGRICDLIFCHFYYHEDLNSDEK